ncbi:MAG: alpha/beta hydrolase [Chloroflexota bacterium]|nr:alpha/beta hydrolase [Chloroflexota bacterium]
MPIKPVSDGFIVANDLTLHYVKWGDQGTPIVAIHGLTANASCFQAFADKLSGDHQLFAYDLRGRGDSDKPAKGYSVPIHAADLAGLLDALGLERPVLIGHSLGALIALYFSTHYPARLSKLVLVDAGAPLPWSTPEEQPAWLTASINRLGTAVPSFEEYTQRLKLAPFLGPYWNEYFDLYFEHDVRRNSDGSVASKCYREGIFEESQRYNEARPEEQWANVQVPTLLLRAGQGMFFANDQLLPVEAAVAAQREIENCRYVNFPTLNHYTILFGVESEPAEEIRSFIDKEE